MLHKMPLSIVVLALRSSVFGGVEHSLNMDSGSLGSLEAGSGTQRSAADPGSLGSLRVDFDSRLGSGNPGFLEADSGSWVRWDT